MNRRACTPGSAAASSARITATESAPCAITSRAFSNVVCRIMVRLSHLRGGMGRNPNQLIGREYTPGHFHRQIILSQVRTVCACGSSNIDAVIHDKNPTSLSYPFSDFLTHCEKPAGVGLFI